MKKKRAAPFGNKNTFKHGLCTATGVAQFLSTTPMVDFTPEVDMIRIMQARLIEAVNASSRPLDSETNLSIVRAANLTLHSIASLQRLKTLSSLTNKESDELRDKLLTPRLNMPKTK